jgi:SRSO17 transposase
MTPHQIEALGPRLEEFLGEFAPHFATRNTRAHFRTYVQGQLGPLERKSIEPIADAAGVSSRNLQEFLSLLSWDEDGVRDQLQHRVSKQHGGEENIGLIDETSFAKKGEETACVQRQYCGATGKVDNCVVSVHLAFACGEFHTLLDSTIYMPKKTWAEDPRRRKKVGIPKEIVYQPLHEIALDQIERARMNGVRLDWIVADERYGEVPAFLETLEGWGIGYVLEVPPGITGWTKRPPREGERVAEGAEKPTSLAEMRTHDPAIRTASEIAYRVKDTLKGPEVWEVKEVPFFQHRKGRVSPPLRLVLARNVLDDTEKAFLSNAPSAIPVQTLLRVAFSRWRIERCFEDSKGEVGLDHFEVRRYGSIRRHLMVSMVSHLFLAEEAKRLRGGKSGRDGVPGEARRGRAPEHCRALARRPASAH